MPVLNNPKHERFAQELAKGKGVTEAYVAAGYDESPASATRLSKKVKNRVDEILGRGAERAELNRAWVLEKLAKNARIALGEEDVTKNVMLRGAEAPVSITVTDRDAGAANRALELLGKEFSMFKDQVEHTGTLTLAEMVMESVGEDDREKIDHRETAH